MEIGIISLFPEMFNVLKYGITRRAIENKIVNLHFYNPRDFTDDLHRTVDDRPYGGGPGMVMKVEPLLKATQSAKKQLGTKTKVVYLTPQGKLLDQNLAKNFAQEKSLIFIAGRYEGVDERFVDMEVDEEISIGDYVLSGGELGIMVAMDVLTRLIPGVLGDENSASQDSFMDGLLDYPHYTRPEEIDERQVPSVLTSGNHQAITRWRRQQALGRTWHRRPDLLAKQTLSQEDKKLLAEYIDRLNEEKNERTN